MSDKHPGGRPTKYNKEYHSNIIYWMAKTGLTDKQMAGELGITEKTLNNWKNAHEEFLLSLKRGKEEPDSKVEDALYQRALGYSHPEDKIFNQNGVPLVVPTIKHYPPDPTAIIFWLKNRRPDKWRDKQEIEHSGDMSVNIGKEFDGI